MNQNIFTVAIQHLPFAEAAYLANLHYDVAHDTEPCSEPDPEASSLTEYDVGETIRCPQPEWVVG